MKYNYLKIAALLSLSACGNDAQEKESNIMENTAESIRIANCNCPGKTIAGQTFFFYDKSKILLCGSGDSIKTETLYSNFSLWNCDKNKELKSWEATDSASVDFFHDTLYIKNIKSLPVGKDFAPISMVFYIDRYFINQDSINYDYVLNKELPKYNETEIKLVRDQYKKACSLYPESAKKYTYNLPERMLMAAISGDEEMGKALLSFEQKFHPLDEALSKKVKECKALYKLYIEKK